ncbi:GDP-mannose 4,6-dehydratase [Catenovulum sp. SM1970]|uniref:NAD-dependent 4,6-dehydratase LegB n=1 Tax=Marinifaba aquimaris TaxID=2741323 RepID=UPI001571B407|nr:NAD-dependent 4,6-dehydratase LegB [Marinifaba aquimaris]NTS75367.1 GDP-mannose 4,6-dehydratase [Marinifaba aquimaris]
MTKVLITGADGFIGSHLTEQALQMGYEVRALSQYNSFNNWGWLEDVACHDNLEVVSGDIRDSFFCDSLVSGCDVVFHLAALIAIPYSYQAPQSYVDTNVSGTLNICEAAKKSGVSRLLHTSTSEVYGTAKYVPIDEKHPIKPQSPYSASKIGADSIAMSYFNSFNLPVTIVRPFNTYGPRQSARAVIPTIISQIASGQKRIKLGDLSPTRDFNFVLDTCKGFLELAECEDAVGEIVNIASNYEISIGDTLNLIKEIMNSDVEFVSDSERLRPSQSEVFRLWGDNKKIKTLTNFSPDFDLKAGLTETIDWFTQKHNLSKYKSTIYNV